MSRDTEMKIKSIATGAVDGRGVPLVYGDLINLPNINNGPGLYVVVAPIFPMPKPYITVMSQGAFEGFYDQERFVVSSLQSQKSGELISAKEWKIDNLLTPKEE